MHYWGYVIDQLLTAREQRRASERVTAARRRRATASGRQWTRAAPRD
jgi:hypothetical protein